MNFTDFLKSVSIVLALLASTELLALIEVQGLLSQILISPYKIFAHFLSTNPNDIIKAFTQI